MMDAELIEERHQMLQCKMVSKQLTVKRARVYKEYLLDHEDELRGQEVHYRGEDLTIHSITGQGKVKLQDSEGTTQIVSPHILGLIPDDFVIRVNGVDITYAESRELLNKPYAVLKERGLVR